MAGPQYIGRGEGMAVYLWPIVPGVKTVADECKDQLQMMKKCSKGQKERELPDIFSSLHTI